MASRFIVGVGVGLGLSFSILQGTTERRIMSIKPLRDDSSGGSSIYQYKLYREMWLKSRPQQDTFLEESGRRIWNTGVQGVASGLNSVTSTISGLLGGDKKKETMCIVCGEGRLPFMRCPKGIYRAVDWYFSSLLVQTLLMMVTASAIVLAIVETYIDQKNFEEVAISLEIVFFCVFLVDLLADAVRAPFLIDYVLSWTFFYDVTACLSILVIFYPHNEYLVFFRFFRVFKILELVKLRHYAMLSTSSRINSINTAAYETSAVTYFVARMAVNILAFVIISSAAVFALSQAEPLGFTERLTFGASVYFVIVTVSTVGYGELHPTSTYPQLLVVVIIIVGFTIIPLQINNLVATLNSRKDLHVENFTTRKHKRHVVICGVVDYEMLFIFASQLLSELEPPSRGKELGLVLCVLSPISPSLRVKTLLAVYKQHIQFLIGSSKSFSDLKRARVHKAQAVIIVPDIQLQTSLREEEDAVFLSAISVAKYLDLYAYRGTAGKSTGNGPPLPPANNAQSFRKASAMQKWQRRTEKYRRPHVVVKMTASARNAPVLLAAGVDIVMSMSELRYSLLAFGTAFPGFVALFNALIGWGNETTSVDAAEKPSSSFNSAHVVRHVSLRYCTPTFKSLSWHEAVLHTYRSSEGRVTIIAASRAVDKAILINPVGLAMSACDSLFAIGDIGSLEQSFDCHFLGAEPTARRHSSASRNSHSEGQTPPHAPAGVADGDADFQGEESLSEHEEGSRTSSQEGREEEGKDDLQYLSRAAPADRLPRAGDASARPGGNSVNPRTTLVPSSSSRVLQSHAQPLPLVNLNRFMAASVAGASKTSAGRRFLPASVTVQQRTQRQRHIVVALTATSHENLTASAIMLPILYFMRSLRGLTSDFVVILCDRADELNRLIPEVSLVSPGVMSNVQFVKGHSRNPDHLGLCGVEKAQAAVIMRPPISAEQSLEDHVDTGSKVGADAAAIICSINLHLLLQQRSALMERPSPLTVSISDPAEGHSRTFNPVSNPTRVGSSPLEEETLQANRPLFRSAPSNGRGRVHVLTEIVHESNAKFLRITSSLATSTTDTDDIAPANSSNMPAREAQGSSGHSMAFSKSTANVHSADWLLVTEHEETVVAPAEHTASSVSQELDLPLLQTGGVHAHLALDNLAVQAIFQPAIVAFWEVAMGISNNPILGAEAGIAVGGEDKEEEEEEEEMEEERREGATGEKSGKLAGEKDIDTVSDSGTSCSASPRLQALDYTPRIHHVTHRSHFDKIKLPPFLAGVTFQEAFESLLAHHGVIVVAIWRHQGHSTDKDLPFVLAAPLPPSLTLKRDDALFVITK